MAIFSSLFALGSTKAVATAAAAVLIVGGGAAVAEVTSADETDEIVEEDEDDETPEEDSTDCLEAATAGLDIANAAGDDDQPGECPPAVEDETTEEGDDALEFDEALAEDEVADLEDEDETLEEPADDGEDQGNAEAFSDWVGSLDGEKLGCLKGQLVSYFARQGPTNFEEVFAEVYGNFDTAQDIAGFLEEEGTLPGRCAERILNGAEGEGSSSQSGKPDHAGPPAHAGDKGKPDHAGDGDKPDHAGPPAHADEPGPPPHAGPKGNGNGPGSSGEARGSGNGQGPGNGNGNS